MSTMASGSTMTRNVYESMDMDRSDIFGNVSTRFEREWARVLMIMLVKRSEQVMARKGWIKLVKGMINQMFILDVP